MKGERRYLNGKLDVNGFVSLNFKLHFIIFIQNVKSQLHNGSFCFLIYLRICTLTRKGPQIHFNTQVPGSVYKYDVTDWTTNHILDRGQTFYVTHEIRVLMLIIEPQIKLQSQMASSAKNIFRSSACINKLNSAAVEMNRILLINSLTVRIRIRNE